MLRNYLITAWRNLWKYKQYSFINILGLSVGIASCLLIALFVFDEITYDKFHSNYRNIYRLNGHFVRPSTGEKMVLGSTSPAMIDALAQEIPEFSGVVRLDAGSALVQTNTDVPVRQTFLFADPSLLEVFDFRLSRGNTNVFKSNPNTVLLDEDLSIKYFGNTNPVGQTISVKLGEEYEALEVAGIIEPVPNNSSIKFKMVIPFDKYRQIASPSRLTGWLDLHMTSIVVLSSGADLHAVEVKMNDIFHANITAEDAEIFSLGLQPLSEIHLGEVRGGNGLDATGNPSASWILAAVGFFVLLIACINFVNLSLGMALPRSREIGLRKVVGAQRAQVRYQFLGESFFITLIAFVVAILLADLFLPLFESLTHKSFVLWQRDNWLLGAVAALTLVFTAVLAGAYPASIVSAFNPVKSLKGKEKVSGTSMLSKTMIIVQFIIGVAFLTGTIIMQRQMEFIQSFDKGYDDQGLISLTMPADNSVQIVEAFKQKLLTYPFIEKIGGSTGSGWRTRLEYNGNTFEVNHDKIDHTFFNTMGVPVKEGRNFDPSSAADQQAIIVNEALVQKLGLQEPIGTRLPFNYFEEMVDPVIIGVVRNYNYQSLHAEIEPMVYYVHSDRPLEQLLIRIDEQATPEAIRLISETWRELIPHQPLVYAFVEDQNLQLYEKELRQVNMIRAASAMAIFLSCLGLFGLASLHIRQRHHEIGLRKVLGAGITTVLITLSKRFVMLVVVACLVAAPLTWWLATWWLESFAYKTDLPVYLFALSGVMMVLLCAVSIAYQTIKTAMVNPVQSLRQE